jgi:hypothetical protein
MSRRVFITLLGGMTAGRVVSKRRGKGGGRF